MLHEIHLEYNLSYPKLTATVTDNASNFVKAFRIVGVETSHDKDKDNNNNEDKDSDNDEDEDSNIDEELDEHLSMTDNTDDSIFEFLPRHIRCFAHTLSLCMTTDVKRAMSKNDDLQNIHKQTMNKCNLLWNAASRPKSAEIVQKILGHTLTRPGDTMWNSLHDSLAQIMKTKEKNYSLHKSLGMKHIILDQEYLYIEEYTNVTRPVSHALDILQGEKNVFYGMVIPCLLSLQNKLQNIRNNQEWTYCKPILESMENSIETRFANYLNFTSQ